MNVFDSTAQTEQHRPFQHVALASREGSGVVKNDDHLEYEENSLIKLEQQVLLQPWRKRQLQLVPQLYTPVVDTPILDPLVEKFIDAFAPDGHDDCGKSSAIRRAGSERMFSPLLNEAFQAVSVAYFAQSIGSRAAVAHSYRGYCRVLHHLQKALIDPSQSRSSGVFATVILLMAYESLQNTSESALIKHCIGALQLIEFRNPWNHMFGIEHICFTELLPYWVATALIMRKPTFLARKEWKYVPWSAPGSYKDIMACLLEEVVDLPAILWRYDQHQSALQTQPKSLHKLSAQSTWLWTSIDEFESRLHNWKRNWPDNHPSGQPYEVPLQGGEPFPVFKYVDSITQQTITPPTLVYPDPQLAQVLCLYYAAMLILSSVDTRPNHRISDSSKLGFAHGICRSLEYYIRTVPGNMINRLAFPIRVAYDALPGSSLERRFIEGVFEYVERKNALRSWGNFLPDISAKG